MDMGYRNLRVEKKQSICLITLNHPPVNAWNLAMMQEFEAAVIDAQNDDSIRVVVITGAGEKCFSAGFDIRDAANALKISGIGKALWTRLDQFSKPVIAAINGFALGGGFELSLSCHFRIMVDNPDATVGLTELNLGIIPGWGGTQRLTRLVGRSKALEMILFSQRIGAAEALDLGLMNSLSSADNLMGDAMAMAKVLAKRPPLAVASVLKAISARDYEGGMHAGLEAEQQGNLTVSASKDRLEGFNAFLEKREPVFKGE